MIRKTAGKFRHYLPPELVGRSRNRVSVVLVGAGGIGSQLASGLARMHKSLVALGHAGLRVSIVDPDVVSDANVGRQLFSPSDVGQNKAVIQATRINNFFGLDFEGYPFPLDRIRANSYIDFLITAVDNVKTRLFARKKILSNVRYWMDTGNQRNTGQVIIGTGSRVGQVKPHEMSVRYLPNAFDLYPDMPAHEKDSVQGPSCSLAASLEQQDLFVSQLVATAALELLWRGFRAGYWTHHGAFINLKSLSVSPLPIDPEVWARMGFKPAEKCKLRRAA